MTKLIALAWRNVWRNRRRTLLTIGAVVFATFIITITSSLQTGTYEAGESYAIQFMTGEIQVHRDGYHEESSLTNSLADKDVNPQKLTDSFSWITHHTRRLMGFGLVSSDSSSAGAIVLGIEPEHEKNISAFTRKPVEGKPLTIDDDHHILLGQTLAKNLGLTIGDTLAVLTQGYRNAMGADLYVLKGLLRTGSLDIDRSMMVMRLSDAQDLFAMPDRYTHLVLRTDDPYQASQQAGELKTYLAGSDTEVMTWEELMPQLTQTRALDDAGNMIFYAFLLILIGFEIFNTTTMSVMERIRELGVLQSIGMKPRELSLLVFFELSIKILIALAVSGILIFGLMLWLKDLTIPLPDDLQKLYESFGFLFEGISFSTRPSVFVFPFVAVYLVAGLAIVYPALKVLRYSPVSAMRHT